jgi:hypothetical protein
VRNDNDHCEAGHPNDIRTSSAVAGSAYADISVAEEGMGIEDMALAVDHNAQIANHGRAPVEERDPKTDLTGPEVNEQLARICEFAKNEPYSPPVDKNLAFYESMRSIKSRMRFLLELLDGAEYPSSELTQSPDYHVCGKINFMDGCDNAARCASCRRIRGLPRLLGRVEYIPLKVTDDLDAHVCGKRNLGDGHDNAVRCAICREMRGLPPLSRKTDRSAPETQAQLSLIRRFVQGRTRFPLMEKTDIAEDSEYIEAVESAKDDMRFLFGLLEKTEGISFEELEEPIFGLTRNALTKWSLRHPGACPWCWGGVDVNSVALARTQNGVRQLLAAIFTNSNSGLSTAGIAGVIGQISLYTC